jgi:hypothetical protein
VDRYGHAVGDEEMKIDISTVASYSVTISIAGDFQTAKESLRLQCLEGLCVTLTPTTFIYTYGAEEGVRVGMVNYPRFPKTPEQIRERALRIAENLMNDLVQRTALIEMPEVTTWLHREEETK